MIDRPVALVTGGAKRVGRAIVEDLSAHGFDVVIHAHSSADDATSLAQTLKQSEMRRAFVVTGDLADEAATREVMHRAWEAAGRLDIIVNNASVFENDQIGALDMALWDRHFAVHLKAPALLAEEMITRLTPNRDALIINLIDQRVWALTPKFFSYTLSKSALWTATQTMAQALAPNVRVNAIGPGPTLANDRQNPMDFQAQVEAVPLKRSADLTEFGRTIRYLWSAKSVTGQMIALDGGQHLAWQTPDAMVKE